MTTKDFQGHTELFKALSNCERLRILNILSTGGEIGVTDLAVQISLSQSATSQHLSRLKETNLVTFRRDSTSVYYSASGDNLARVLTAVSDVFSK